MPRVPRKYIRTSFYHVMCQGIKKENIFNSYKKMDKYLELINKYKVEYGISIVTYCIMSNHVHLLLYTDSIDMLSKFMHKLNGTYGKYYNKVEERVGYVFRNRFKMEGIDNEKYVFNCILYIHANPVKAGICKLPSEYYYSGYREFVDKCETIDNKIVKQILDKDTYIQKEKKFIVEKINYIDLDVDTNKLCKEIIETFVEKMGVPLNDILNDEYMLTKLLIELKIKNEFSYSCIEKNLCINRKRISKLCPKKGQA